MLTKLFLFDLDGTLMTTGGAGLRALERTFHELYGINQVSHYINPSGKTDIAIFREIIKSFLLRELKPEEQQSIVDTYLNYLQTEVRISTRLKILAGVEEVLGYLNTRSDSMVALGTGNLEKGARIKLEPVKLNTYFSFGGFGSDAEDRAEVLRIAHDRAQKIRNDEILATETYVIGDTPLDVKAAKRAGFRSVSVATGNYSMDDLKKEQPDYLMKNLTEGFELMLSI